MEINAGIDEDSPEGNVPENPSGIVPENSEAEGFPMLAFAEPNSEGIGVEEIFAFDVACPRSCELDATNASFDVDISKFVGWVFELPGRPFNLAVFSDETIPDNPELRTNLAENSDCGKVPVKESGTVDPGIVDFDEDRPKISNKSASSTSSAARDFCNSGDFASINLMNRRCPTGDAISVSRISSGEID